MAGAAESNRRILRQHKPSFIVDGLGPLNPKLAIGVYPDLREWLAGYAEIGRTPMSVVYRLASAPHRSAFGKEGSDPFLRIFGPGIGNHDLLGAAVGLEIGGVNLLVEGPLSQGHRIAAGLRDAVGELPHTGAQLRGSHNAIHKAPLGCDLGRDGT